MTDRFDEMAQRVQEQWANRDDPEASCWGYVAAALRSISKERLTEHRRLDDLNSMLLAQTNERQRTVVSLRAQVEILREGLNDIAAWDFLSNASQWFSMKKAREALARAAELEGNK